MTCRPFRDGVICGPGPAVADTTSDCPDRAVHAPCPGDPASWFDWADAMAAAGARQERCPACRRWAIWTEPERKVEWP